MQKLGAVRRALGAGELDGTLSRLKYGEISGARAKVAHVLDGFARSFGDDEERPVVLCSAPGRTEICGNHTDHQHGRVLAGAVDLDFLACAAPNGLNRIRFQSEGWPMVEISLDELLPRTDERESTAALVRGMAGLVKERGYEVAGFDAYAVSEVLPGSGLSSSAACEVLLGVIENCLFCSGELDAVTIAQLGQRAENVYFGKPSGLMDQTASSVGGAVAIDFADPAEPVVRSVAVDLESLGYALCIIDSGASHAALTGEYASIPEEMGAVAARLADFSVVTSDNPRTEDPNAILASIEEGIKPTGGKYVIIENRRDAIRHALEMGRDGDVIILAGKGHETYQDIMGVKRPFDEKVVVQELLRELQPESESSEE